MSALGFKASVVPNLLASSLICNGFLRLTSGVTPADLLIVRISATPFLFTYLYTQGLEPRIERVEQCVQACNRLSHAGVPC